MHIKGLTCSLLAWELHVYSIRCTEMKTTYVENIFIVILSPLVLQ